MNTSGKRMLLGTIGMASLVSPFCPVHAVDNTAAGAKSGTGMKTSSRPNIVLIVADDLGWADLGVTGSRYYETPAIDKLAAEGVLFTSNYSCGPNCAPSRASLMTGMYTPRHGILTVDNSDRGPAKERKLIPVENITVLDKKITTIADVLKKSGYATASVGKWHLGDGETGPQGHGFDINVGGGKQGQPPSYFSPYKLKNLRDGKDGEYLTDRITDEALKVIDEFKEKEFFLYLPHYAVHAPVQAPDEITGKFKAKKSSDGQNNPTYAAMIQKVDEGVGKVVAKIDELGLREKTCIIFISDNGGVIPTTSNAPLRGGKGMLYEGGIRVPMIIRWPGRVPSGGRNETPVIGADLFPTMAEIAGVKLPEDAILDGLSLFTNLTEGKPLPARAIYWHFPCYLQGADKSNNDEFFRTRPCGSIREGDWKLLEFFEDGRLELYNLKADIGEKKNLANEMSEKVKELHEKLSAWRKEVGAKMPGPLR